VSLGNFLIKSVAEQLQRELPRIKTFCTLSPVPGLAAWLLGEPDFAALPHLRRHAAADFEAARQHLLKLCDGDLAALQRAATHERMDKESTAALLTLCAAYLLHLSPTPEGDPVARFHLDNGARLERLNAHGNMSAKGLKQSFAIMVNYLYDLDKVEASHEKFKQGEVARSRAVHTVM
jgi:malonyl-CoA decarboxylase